MRNECAYLSEDCVVVSSDCLTDRQAVLDEMRTNNNEMYIPECTPDGRYQKVQCYRSTGQWHKFSFLIYFKNCVIFFCIRYK